MRRREWIIGGILGLLVVAGLIVLLYFLIDAQPVETVRINNIKNSTALEAFNLAQPVAEEWASDAVLYTARASWQPEVDFRDGRSSWSMVFYSPSESATATITVANAQAQFVRSRPLSQPLELGSLANWQVDSPAAIANLLDIGADEFMRLHAKVNLILTLDTRGTPTWRSTFLDTESKETYYLNITIDSGEFTP